MTTAGDFVGSITASNFASIPAVSGTQDTDVRFAIARDLDADVNLEGRVFAAAASTVPEIEVGRDFKAGRTFTVGTLVDSGVEWYIGRKLLGTIDIQNANGLKGTLVVNSALSDGDLPTQVLGTVKVNSTTLALPFYSNQSATLGGGSIGLARFALHAADCQPQPPAANQPVQLLQTQFQQTGSVAGVPITLAFYGPVFAPVAGTSPVDVEMKVPYTGLWMPVTDYVNVTVNQPSDPALSRTVTLSGKPVGGGDTFVFAPGRYRILPNLNTTASLANDLPGASKVRDFSWGFDLGRDCDANGVSDYIQLVQNPQLDLNGDGLLDACFPNPVCSADFNGDGFVDDIDFVVFSAAYEEFTSLVGDLNGDYFTDDADFVLFSVQYSRFACP